MKGLLLCLLTSFLIISCGSLLEETEDKSPLSLDSESVEKSKRTEIYGAEDLKVILGNSDIDLLFNIIFPSYTIIPGRKSLPDDPILRLIELKKRYYKYNDLHQSNFSDNEITAIYADEDFYYLGSARGGIFRYSIADGKFLEIKIPLDSLVNQSITGILKYKEKIIISSFSGLYSYDLFKKTLTQKFSDGKNYPITSISAEGEYLFLGTADGRFFQWTKYTLAELFQIKHNIINAIFCKEERVYLGTSQGGVYEYNLISGEYKILDFVNKHLEKKKITFISHFDEKYWVGAAGDGLLVFDENTGELLAEKREEWFLSTCHSENIIYFGTHANGLLYYDRIKEVVSSWGIRDGLSSLYIPSLFQVNGSVYISTPEEGVLIISEEIHE